MPGYTGHRGLALLLHLLLLSSRILRCTGKTVTFSIDNTTFATSFDSDAQVLDFCRLSSMTHLDCLELQRSAAVGNSPDGSATEHDCPTSLYIVPMGSKIHNFGPVFEQQPNGEYLHTNPNAPDWLLSILKVLGSTRVEIVQIVPPWRQSPEAGATSDPWVPPTTPTDSCTNVIVLLIVSLHQFGMKGIERYRAELLVRERDRIMRLFRGDGRRGGVGRVAAVIADDEFFSFPLDLYERLDLVFRLGDWDPRLCSSQSSQSESVCSHVHWIPRGPSSKFLEAISTQRSTLRPASKRRFLANFIGNVDASICIGETDFTGNGPLTKFYPPRPLKTCYRTTARPAALSGLRKMDPKFKSRLFLRPTSGFGLDAKHGLNISSSSKSGGALRPSEFAEALLDSVFTVCAPSTSAESTRIYEALEAGSIPIVWHAGAEGGLPFGPTCPLPQISRAHGSYNIINGAHWEKSLPDLIRSWERRGPAALMLC